jgi:hypothetical protein
MSSSHGPDISPPMCPSGTCIVRDIEHGRRYCTKCSGNPAVKLSQRTISGSGTIGNGGRTRTAVTACVQGDGFKHERSTSMAPL